MMLSIVLCVLWPSLWPLWRNVHLDLWVIFYWVFLLWWFIFSCTSDLYLFKCTGNWFSYINMSVQFSCSVVSDSLWSHGLQHARPPCPSQTPRVHPNSHPLSLWCHPSLSSPSPPGLNLSQHQGLFQWINSSCEVAKVLEFQLQHQSFQWTHRTDLL